MYTFYDFRYDRNDLFSVALVFRKEGRKKEKDISWFLKKKHTSVLCFLKIYYKLFLSFGRADIFQKQRN